MTAFDSFPLGQPAFVTHILDRARICAQRRETVRAGRAPRRPRLCGVSRLAGGEAGAEGPRALLTIDEALKFGANPGTIFLGLRDGAAVFGMGIAAAAVEKLLTRDDAAVTELRGMAMQGVVRPTSSRRSRWRNRWWAGTSAMATAPIAEPAPR